MPIYVYRCDDCSQVHEAFQKASDAYLRTCPHCGHEALRKLIAPVGIIFKGSGFHKNDYASTAQRASGEAASGEAAPKPSPSPESQPAVGAEKKAGGTETKVA